MRDPAYLGDLGGLAAHRQLIVLNLRGTGKSAVPADPGSYRCDRQVADVAALGEHLRLGSFDLLGHSAGRRHFLSGFCPANSPNGLPHGPHPGENVQDEVRFSG